MRKTMLLGLVTVFAASAAAQDATTDAPVSETPATETIAPVAAAPAPASEESETPAGMESDEPAAASAPVAAPSSTNQARIQPREGWEARNHWENAFDTKFTSFFDREASDLESPTVMLGAQWNYKFKYDTYLGVSAAGMPQSVKIVDDETGVETSYAMYYSGAYLAQGLFESRPFRAVVGVTYGRGLLYSRAKIPGQDLEATENYFTVLEPTLFVTVWEYKGVELGMIASSRQVKQDVEVQVAEDSDLSSVAYGLTFRTQRY